MGKIEYRTKRGLRKALAVLMTASMVVTAVQVPAFAASEEVAESTASVSGVFSRKIVLDLLSDDLRTAAIAAIRDNNLFDAKDYLGATSDNKQATKEYEAFFNENPGLYVVEVPSSVADVLSSEADAELRIFVQKDYSTYSKDVEFRYGSEKDLILYEPSSDVDILVNGGEDAYYREPEQDMSDDGDYELTGNEKITFMFVNKGDNSVRFTLKVDGIVYDKVDVSGRDAALKKILADAGIKKTEETTKAVVETTAAVTVAPETVSMTGTEVPVGAEVPAEDATAAIGPAVPGDDTTPDTGAVVGPMVPTGGMEGAADAAEPKEEKVTDAAETESGTVITETVETAVKTDDQTQVTVETDETVVAETADQNSDTENGTAAEADVKTDSTGTENNSSNKTEGEVQADDTAGKDSNETEADDTAGKDSNETEADDAAALDNHSSGTEAEVQTDDIVTDDNGEAKADGHVDTEVQDSGAAAENDTAGNVDSEVSSEANVEENDDTAEKTDIVEKIQDAVQEAADKVADTVLGRMVAWADTIDDEGHEYTSGEETTVDGQDDVTEETNDKEDGQEASDDNDDIADQTNDTTKTEEQENADSGDDQTVDADTTVVDTDAEAGVADEADETLVAGAADEAKEALTAGVADETDKALAAGGLDETDEALVAGAADEAKEALTAGVADETDKALTAGGLDETDETLVAGAADKTDEALTAGIADEVNEASTEDGADVENTALAAGTEDVVAEVVSGENVTGESAITSTDDAQAAANVTVGLVETAGTVVEVQETEAAAKPVATASEIEKTEYDDFAKEMIAEVKEAVKEDREAAKESIMVAKVVQYTLNELGRIHYETETDGYSVDVFAERDVFGGISPTLEVKKLYKPEEAYGGEDVLSQAEIAELKDKNIYENSQSLDIHFVDGDGNEVEPTGPVKVRITVNDSDLLNSIDASTLEVHHIKETATTLKTEMVASTDDVKALDANEEKISDADLEANAEAIAAGEEAEVPVASAVAEFEVTSFSTFTITWTHNSKNLAEITVHYVATNGYAIIADENVVSPINLENGSVKLSEVEGGVTNYTYKEARLGSITGTVIDTVKGEQSTSGNKTYYNVNYYDAEGHEVESDGAGYVSKKDHTTTVHNDIYLIYERNEVPHGGDVIPINLGEPTTDKTVVPNGDGTYTLTLSVTGASKGKTTHTKANVLVVLDTSSSMTTKTTGTRTRLYEAKESVNSLAEQLLGHNTDENPDGIELALMTFDSKVRMTTNKTTNLEGFQEEVNGVETHKGTNWEAALLAANAYDFDDDDPIYVIFVSDGNPSLRVSNNAGTGVWLDDYEAYGPLAVNADHLAAAKLVAQAIEEANKQLYAINAYGDANRMQEILGEENKNNYHDVRNQTELNEAFSQIIGIIEQNLSYTNVSVEDGLTNLTASVVVSGGTSNYKYEIVKANGTVIEHDDVPAGIKTAAFSDGSVVWNIGGENYKLEDGATYKVSFVIWPKQETFDTITDYLNGKTTTEPSGNFGQDEDGNWIYKTNTSAGVHYQTIEEVTGSDPQLSAQKYAAIEKDPHMTLAATQINVEKIWKLDDPSQEAFLHDSSITLTLQRNGVNYKTDIVLNDTGATVSQDGKEVTWINGSAINISPGILVSKTKGDGYGFPASKLLQDRSYYMLETGYDYKFTERAGNISFVLEDRTYHPMLVDGVLMDVAFTHDAQGHITGVENISELEELTKLVATNVIELDELKVSKTYTGNLAKAQTTTFDLYMYTDNTGSQLASLAAGYIQAINHSVAVTQQSDGAYRFNINPTKVGTAAEVTIVVPKGISYKIVEVKAGTGYSDYDTKWGTTAETVTTEGNVTDVLKLGNGQGEVKTVYFINNKNLITPTGVHTDVNPFTLLGLVGLAALIFLAYDFMKKRLFEEE